MPKYQIQRFVAYILIVLFALSALGYFFAPAPMLDIVGIASDAQSDFLIRTLAAALLPLALMTWTVRNRNESKTQGVVLLGLATYMFLSSVVDLHAYVNNLVGVIAVPSIAFRTLLGSVLLYLAKR